MSEDSSTIVIKTIEDYFNLDKSDVTHEQQIQLTKFLNSTVNTVLVIEKNDESPNQVVFTAREASSTGNGNKWHQSDNTLVFVKYAKNVDNSANDEIINETETISRIRSVLHRCDGSSSSVMHALSDLRRAAKMPQVLQALKAERAELVAKVVSWAENCGEIDDNTHTDITDRIGVLKAREGKLKAVVRVCDSLFNDIPNYRELKSTLEQIQKELSDESLRLFREWYESMKDVKLDNRKQCIEIDTSSQVPKVTFDPRLVKLSQDAKILRCLSFAIPPDIVAVEDDVRKYGVYARELREIVNFYCSVADQILLSQRPMLIDAAKKFTALLESRDRISWNEDPNKLTTWLEELKRFSKSFSTENRTLRKHHNKVLQLIKPLFEIQLVKWRTNINEVKTIMQEIDFRYQNTLPWKRHWDHQLYKILEYHFNYLLIKSNNLLSFGSNISYSFTSSMNSTTSSGEAFKIDLCFISGSVAFKPSLEEIKAKIYARIKSFLSMPKQFEGFVPLTQSSKNKMDTSSDNTSIFYAIYLRNFNNFSILYEKANEMIEELLQVRQKFVDWCSLYYLIRWQNTEDSDSESLAQFLGCHTLDDYKNNLMLIKSKAQKFNKDFIDTEIVCESGSFIINVVPIKTFIDWLLIEIDKLLARSLKEKCDQEIKIINEKCSELLLTISKRPENINELIKIDNLFKTEFNAISNDLSVSYNDLEAKLSFLMKWSSKIAPDLSEVKAKYDEFERISETKDSLLDSYRFASNLNLYIYITLRSLLIVKIQCNFVKIQRLTQFFP